MIVYIVMDTLYVLYIPLTKINREGKQVDGEWERRWKKTKGEEWEECCWREGKRKKIRNCCRDDQPLHALSHTSKAKIVALDDFYSQIDEFANGMALLINGDKLIGVL